MIVIISGIVNTPYRDLPYTISFKGGKTVPETMRNNNKGFTLIEVVLTMAVLAIATAMIASVIYSLIYMKNNTYADNDTRGDIEITERYLNTVFAALDKNGTGNYFYFSSISAECEVCPQTEEDVNHKHSHSVTFYNREGIEAFSIIYDKENGIIKGERRLAKEGNETDEQYSERCDSLNLPADFTYKFSGRIEGVSMRCYDKNGELITANDENAPPKVGTLTICEIYFTNTKGRTQTYTVIITRKTTP